ncbi:MAG: ATP-dependent dethiobiotin synthetase BioD, partial [Bacteroidetes bacterium SW_10_40_5]
MSRNIFIAGTGTDVGKTIVAAIITQKLEADYWKPIQAGNLYDTDTMTVQRLVSNAISSFHHETYRLQVPASPHDAASQEEIRIDEDVIKPPQTDQALIIEGAGGLMVP